MPFVFDETYPRLPAPTPYVIGGKGWIANYALFGVCFVFIGARFLTFSRVSTLTGIRNDKMLIVSCYLLNVNCFRASGNASANSEANSPASPNCSAILSPAKPCR